MLGVLIIAVVFIALAGGIFYIAMYGGGFGALTKALETTTRSGSRLLNSTLVFVYLAFGIAVPLIFIIGNNSKSNAQVGGIPLTAQMKAGRELFAEHCAVCHTLMADNAVGKIGPNLDQLKPNLGLIENTIANGCAQQPATADAADTCLYYGNMPPDIVQGPEAVDVAKFVAAVAGHR